MTVRLLAVSTAANTDAALHEAVRRAQGEVELVLHLGGGDADFKASAVSRMNLRRGRRGHLTEGTRWSGLAHGLFMQPDYDAQVDDFIDHLHRRAEPHAHLPHRLQDFHAYWDYHHILADVIAQRIAESGATHALFFNVPHLVHDTLVYQVARAMGLPTLIVTQSLFPNRFLSMPTIEAYGRLRPGAEAGAPFPINREETLQHFYMKGIGQQKVQPGRITPKAVAQLVAFLATQRPLQAFNPFYVAGLVRRMKRVYGGLPDWRDPFARFFHESELAYFEHLLSFEVPGRTTAWSVSYPAPGYSGFAVVAMEMRTLAEQSKASAAPSADGMGQAAGSACTASRKAWAQSSPTRCAARPARPPPQPTQPRKGDPNEDASLAHRAGPHPAVIAEVAGEAFYTGTASFTVGSSGTAAALECAVASQELLVLDRLPAPVRQHCLHVRCNSPGRPQGDRGPRPGRPARRRGRRA